MIKRPRPRVASVVVLSSIAILISGVATAQIAIEDSANLDERNRDQSNSKKSGTSKEKETGQRKAVVCTFSNKYRNEMFRRSPQQALAHDTANVSLIRYYAKKYGVSEGLALSVSYQEARFDTCAGSHTGVKGAMQLTQGTGKGLGFDREINEQNIEGGVKLLSMGAKKCGETNYSCLASFYNGSNATEQANWAAGVGRWHGYFNNFAGSGNAPAAVPPQFSVTTVDASKSVGSVQTGAVGAVNTVTAGLEKSAGQRSQATSLIDSMAGGVGTKQEYMDTWDENTTARGLNAQLLNQYIQSSASMNQLLNSRLQMKTTQLSQATKSVSYDGTENPFSCDPVLLRKLNLPENRWQACAQLQSKGGTADESILVTNGPSAAQHLEQMQQQAQ